MKQNKYSILPAIIEALIILTTSMLTLLLREVPGMMTYIIPITLLAVYILLKFFYRKGTSWIHRHATSKGSVANLSTEIERFDHPLGKAEVQKKRMELFHHEFQLEQQSYLLQKEKENDLKLAAILKYTRDTFKRLDFDVTPHVGVWIETNVQATPVGPLNLRYRRYFQSSSFKKETNSGEFRSFGSKVIVCIGKGFTGGFIIPATTPDIKIDRFATQRKVLNYFFIYKTTGNDSTVLVIKTFHIILLIKPNFDF